MVGVDTCEQVLLKNVVLHQAFQDLHEKEMKESELKSDIKSVVGLLHTFAITQKSKSKIYEEDNWICNLQGILPHEKSGIKRI